MSDTTTINAETAAQADRAEQTINALRRLIKHLFDSRHDHNVVERWDAVREAQEAIELATGAIVPDNDPTYAPEPFKSFAAMRNRLAKAEGLIARLAEWNQQNPKGRIYPIGQNDCEHQLDSICEAATTFIAEGSGQ